LEEQGRIDDLACLLIELEQFAPSYLRDNKILSQVDSWTDEDREQIHQIGRESGVSMRRFYDLNRKIQDKPKQKESTQSLTSLIADLHDENVDRSMDSLSVAGTVYSNFATTFRNMRNMVESESNQTISVEAKQKCYELFDLFEDIKKYISNQFRL
jgi:HPt (histidine-containing phosphotransfer) domain-containing protein